MNSGKKISAWWNNLLCFLFGHSLTYVCTRCGKVVDLKGKKRTTLEDRINTWWNSYSKKTIANEPEYKGSLALKKGLFKYELDLQKDTLSLVPVVQETELIKDKKGNLKYGSDGFPKTRVVKRKAKFNPCCVYIDAMSDKVAISKANNYLFGRKKGVVITRVEPNIGIECNTLTINTLHE
jgi:hypothetical protein